MSMRSLGIVSAVVFLVALVTLQLLRIAEKADRGAALVESILLVSATVILVLGIFLGQELVSAVRWRRTSRAAPLSAPELLVVGEYRDEAVGPVRVGVFVGPGELAIVDARGSAGTLRTIRLSQVRSAEVRQLDSAVAWETQLEVTIVNEPSVTVSLDGWRGRRRAWLFAIAERAARRIRERAGLTVQKD